MSAARTDTDAAAVRRAALLTALQVAGVSAGVVIASLGLAALFIVDQSRPSELLERPRPGERKIFVDANDVLIALVVLGVAAIVVVGVASWAISRRAVAPLGTALQVQRAFVADASHELRTPLTVLDARLQVLRAEAAEEGAPTAGLDAVRGDVARMVDLVNDLLLVADSTRTEGERPGDGSDLRPAVLAAAQDLQLLAEGRGVRIEPSVENEARVPLTEAGLRRALVVLLDNAVQHSGAGATVRVSARVERGRAVVRVEDEGAGIVGIEPDRVFDRFAHGTETGRRRGFGIGLALVRDLAARVGGRVEVESTSSAGTTMRLELPVVR